MKWELVTLARCQWSLDVSGAVGFHSRQGTLVTVSNRTIGWSPDKCCKICSGCVVGVLMLYWMSSFPVGQTSAQIWDGMKPFFLQCFSNALYWEGLALSRKALPFSLTFAVLPGSCLFGLCVLLVSVWFWQYHLYPLSLFQCLWRYRRVNSNMHWEILSLWNFQHFNMLSLFTFWPRAHFILQLLALLESGCMCVV